MPRYDYFCPSNNRSVEVTHSIKATLRTWGELCKAAGMDRGGTSPSASVRRMVGPVMLLGTRHGSVSGARHAGGSCCGEAGCHG